MEDERDVLESMYMEDFEAGTDPRSGRVAWRIRMPDVGVTFIAKLPSGYPDCSEAPTLALEFEPWPAGGDAFAARMAKELTQRWDVGQTCVVDWVLHVRDALGDNPPELGAGGAAAAAVTEGEASGGAHATEAAGTGIVPLDAASAKAIGPSLTAAGFEAHGGSVFGHARQGITVEVGAELSITVDGIESEDLSDWATAQLEADAQAFGERLVQWVIAQRSEEPGFTEEDAGEDNGGGLQHLPSKAEVGATDTRELLVYTWGKALRKSAPPDSEHNFNAGILNGRGGGADLRTMNGLSDEVQSNVASCGLFPRWISMVCAKVEHSNCKVISINCTKGRHRSVAAAEILKKQYYPNAQLKHLTIY